MLKRILCIFFSVVILMSSFAVPVFAENRDDSVQNISLLSSSDLTVDDIPPEFDFVLTTKRFYNNGGFYFSTYYFNSKNLKFDRASQPDGSIIPVLVAGNSDEPYCWISSVQSNNGNVFESVRNYGFFNSSVPIPFITRINFFPSDYDLKYLAFTNVYPDMKHYLDKIWGPGGTVDESDDINYNKVDGYDESIFEKMPILDFSNCETPLDYIKTFFTWIWDMILWSVQLVKDFFKMLHNINTFITNFISNFVKQIVNTVKEIANKFIDTLIERVKDITNAVAEVVLEFLKKWFIPSEEFLNEHYSTMDKTLKGKIGDYSSVVETFKNFFADLSGSRYRSAFASAPIIEGEYKGVTLAIDFSFLDPYIENIRLFIGGIMCVAQTWWFIRHLPSLIGRVPAANTKSYEPEKSSDSDSKSNKGG